MKRRLGFTLIELLVVIAIIAILAAILFPVFTEAKKRGQMTTCLNNLKQLGQAFQQYCADNADRMPRLTGNIWYPDWCGSEGLVQPVHPEKGQLWRYVRNRAVYLCPVDWKVPPAFMTGANSGYTPPYPQWPLSYSVSSALRFDMTFNRSVGNKSSRMIMIIHEARDRINDGFYAFNSGADAPSKVHYDGTTLCYCDGHAKYGTWDELDAEKKTGIWNVANPPPP